MGHSKKSAECCLENTGSNGVIVHTKSAGLRPYKAVFRVCVLRINNNFSGPPHCTYDVLSKQCMHFEWARCEQNPKTPLKITAETLIFLITDGNPRWTGVAPPLAGPMPVCSAGSSPPGVSAKAHCGARPLTVGRPFFAQIVHLRRNCRNPFAIVKVSGSHTYHAPQLWSCRHRRPSPWTEWDLHNGERGHAFSSRDRSLKEA